MGVIGLYKDDGMTARVWDLLASHRGKAMSTSQIIAAVRRPNSPRSLRRKVWQSLRTLRQNGDVVMVGQVPAGPLGGRPVILWKSFY